MPPGEIVSGKFCWPTRERPNAGLGSTARSGTARHPRSTRGDDLPGTRHELKPVFTIGAQIGEAIQLHNPNKSKSDVRADVLRLLNEVRMSEPERRVDQYPHELSGGMKQRAMIAMALSCNPQLIIADEPTTALDVTIQARILDLLRKLRETHRTAVLLITHDLGVVAETADDVVVMYAGRVVEQADVSRCSLDRCTPTRSVYQQLAARSKRRSKHRTTAGDSR